jgi:hypothetical protein
MDDVEYQEELTIMEIVELWFDLPLKEKTIMLLKQFRRGF